MDGRQYVLQRGQLRFLPGLQTAMPVNFRYPCRRPEKEPKPLAVKNFANLHKILPILLV